MGNSKNRKLYKSLSLFVAIVFIMMMVMGLPVFAANPTLNPAGEIKSVTVTYNKAASTFRVQGSYTGVASDIDISVQDKNGSEVNSWAPTYKIMSGSPFDITFNAADGVLPVYFTAAQSPYKVIVFTDSFGLGGLDTNVVAAIYYLYIDGNGNQIVAPATADMTFALTTPAAVGSNTISTNTSTKVVTVNVANTTNSVVITGTKTANQTVTVGGPASGSVVNGGTPTAPTYTIDTSGVSAAGGTKTFSLAVDEDGLTAISYTVNVTVAPPVQITGFSAISDINAGTAGAATYADANAVRAVLPANVTASGIGITVPVASWTNTDSYNPNMAGSYTFTAVLGAIPVGYANAGNYTATVEAVVSPQPATANVTFALTTPAANANNIITINQSASPKTVSVTVVNNTSSVTITGAATINQSISVGGTAASAVTTGGSVTAPTFTINTSSVSAIGGSIAFTLTVSEAIHTNIVYNVTVNVNTPLPLLGGTVTITGTPTYGQQLTAVTTGLTNQSGTKAYQWNRDGSAIGSATSSTYTLVAADIGHTISVTVTSSGNSGFVTSSSTAAVAKLAGPSAPSAPTVSGTPSFNTITLSAISGAEFSINTSGGAVQTASWQTSNVFTGLNPYIAYTFIARIAATATTNASSNSAASATITTDRLPAPGTPAAPTVSGSPTANSITLGTIAGAEYAIKSVSGAAITLVWQDPATFNSLTPGTDYTFVDRIKQTATTYASAVSAESATITTSFAALGGTVTITGTPTFGQVLTANTSALTSQSGTKSYQWNRGGSAIGSATSSTYTLVAADVGQTITVTVTSSRNLGSVTSAATAAVAKAAGPSAPSAPTVSGTPTFDTITLSAISGAEFTMNTSGGAVQTPSWQTSNVYTGLNPNTAYTFIARIAATATTNASINSSVSATITTDRLPAPGTPAAPVVSGSPTANSITLGTIGGAEYAIKSVSGAAITLVWQDPATFNSLTPGTDYTFVDRIKQTATTYASAVSAESATITTSFAALGGTVTITGTPTFGQVLTANTSALTSQSGTKSYQWNRGGSPIGSATSSTYTLAAADVGQTISVTVTSSRNLGSVTSGATAAVAKASGPSAPSAPAVSGTPSFNTITLSAISGAEFTMNTSGGAVQTPSWQTSNVYTGLNPNTAYTFIARIAATATTNASINSSVSATITTDRLPAPGTPAAPVVSGSPTVNSITLGTIAGAEYAIKSVSGAAVTTIWQDPATFNSLTPGTDYTFVARIKQTATTYASAASAESATITTTFAALGGTVTITGTPTFGQVLTANTSALTSQSGTKSYQWNRGGIAIGSAISSTYTLAAADVGQTISVTVTSSRNLGSVTSAATAAVAKAAGPSAPSAPTISGTPSFNTITLSAISGAEFAINTSAGAVQIVPSWQASNVFTGLNPNTVYTFIAYIPASATTYASINSAVSATITTDRNAAPGTPAAPTVSGSPTINSITLGTIAGAEYAIKSVSGAAVTAVWQDSSSFYGLIPATDYTFVARIKQTSTTYASAISTESAIMTTQALYVLTSSAITTSGSSISCTVTVSKDTATALTDARLLIVIEKAGGGQTCNIIDLASADGDGDTYDISVAKGSFTQIRVYLINGVPNWTAPFSGVKSNVLNINP